jgi:hypothetical protein
MNEGLTLLIQQLVIIQWMDSCIPKEEEESLYRKIDNSTKTDNTMLIVSVQHVVMMYCTHRHLFLVKKNIPRYYIYIYIVSRYICLPETSACDCTVVVDVDYFTSSFHFVFCSKRFTKRVVYLLVLLIIVMIRMIAK